MTGGFEKRTPGFELHVHGVAEQLFDVLSLLHHLPIPWRPETNGPGLLVGKQRCKPCERGEEG
jgi:hypothetical protein